MTGVIPKSMTEIFGGRLYRSPQAHPYGGARRGVVRERAERLAPPPLTMQQHPDVPFFSSRNSNFANLEKCAKQPQAKLSHTNGSFPGPSDLVRRMLWHSKA